MAQAAHNIMLHKLQAELDAADDAVLDAVKRRRDAERQLRDARRAEGIEDGFSVSLTFQQTRRLMADPAIRGEETLFTNLLRGDLNDNGVSHVVVTGANMLQMWDQARAFFGHEVGMTEMATQRELIERVLEEDGTVGILAWVAAPGAGAWWSTLNETRFHSLRIVAVWPSLSKGTPNIAIIAKAKLAPSGNDDTLMMAHDEHFRGERILKQLDFEFEELNRIRSHVVLRVSGFIEEDDPRIQAARDAGLDELRVVGALPRL